MATLTLLVKASNAGQLKKIDDLLKSEFENLDLEVKVLGNPVNRWVQVSLSGEDEVIATSYINKEIGTCPINIKNVDKFSVLKGYISKVDTDKQELKVDVGIFEPMIIQATIPLAYLQAQLADGRKVDLKKISEVYGFNANLPISVKTICLNGKEDKLLQAELSTAQIEKIRLWQQSLLDRLIVLGSSIGEIEKVLERTRLNRDVIGTEALGLFEHALTCKLGTDATGLIPKIGRYMKNSTFVIFSPEKVRGFIGESALNL
ncbi:MAG TPA: DUF2110 family protein [Candidatus Bathyarchaeia archaeon]|nr:DUF2110 family protein [Candidatus Bathyarchaeia archaeon]